MLILFFISSFIVSFLNLNLMELSFLSVIFLFFNMSQMWYGAGFSDILSNVMIVLTFFFLIIFVVMASKYLKSNKLSYKLLVFILSWAVVACFWFKSIWAFYIFFEFSLIPLLLIIYWYGYQVERLQASFYLFFYTMVGSLPLLFGLLFISETMNISSFFMLDSGSIWFSTTAMIILSFIFFIKLPVFLFHLWLPKAHVEAPVMGSMILAAILLKLGGYGLYRFFFLMMSQASILLMSLSLWGALLSAIICFIQSDMKSLVAYSSISHMGVMMGGFFMFSYFSIKGFFIILVSHAFCSSALFYFVNLLYERGLSRQLIMTRAMKAGIYFLLVYFFIFLAANFSAPPSFNLVGELIFFISFFSYSIVMTFLLGGVSFFVAFYCIYAYSNSAQGEVWKFKGFFFMSDYDWAILMMHGLPIFFMLFFLREI